MGKDCYEILVRFIVENQNHFYRIAYSYLRNKEDALDAVQNTACKALENYQKLRTDTALKMWVYRILVNESMQLIRDKKKLFYLITQKIKCQIEFMRISLRYSRIIF